MPKLLYRSTIPKPDDPDIIDIISDAIRIGHPLSTAAALAGIFEGTLYEWRYQGDAELAEAKGNLLQWEELGSHARLVVHIKEAQAGFTEDALRHMRSGGKDWAMWCTLLERRRPQDFGRRTEVSVKSESVIVHVTAQLSEATQAKVWAIAARAQKALPPPADS